MFTSNPEVMTSVAQAGERILGPMLQLPRRHPQPSRPQPGRPGPTPPTTLAIDHRYGVHIADGLADVVEPLRALLHPAFRVATGHPCAHGVAVLRPHGVATVSYWRAKYPAAVLIVAARGSAPADACAYLDAGADYYLDGWEPRLLAAYVTAAARRDAGTGRAEAGPAPAA